jgi:transposase
MHKKTQQKFYQIPLGGFLNMLERKLKNRINLHFIDESHTSKTSCLSKDVNKMKILREKSEKSLSTNDYGGSRVKRGFFRDYKTNILFHADINGAINHIKVKFGKLNFSWLKNYKQKICNPIILDKSENFAIL